jgi:hypothetical protein
MWPATVNQWPNLEALNGGAQYTDSSTVGTQLMNSIILALIFLHGGR